MSACFNRKLMRGAIRDRAHYKSQARAGAKRDMGKTSSIEGSFNFGCVCKPTRNAVVVAVVA